MNDIMFITALVSISVVLLWLFFQFIYKPYSLRQERKLEQAARHKSNVGPKQRSCPVCGQAITSASLVKSKLFGEKASEQLMHVYGCPLCWPDNTEHVRICPVCSKTVPRGGYLIARYYEKNYKKHVHVLGCTGCRQG